MKITVIAKPKKKRIYVEQISNSEYVVSVSEPPVNGKANEAIIKSLSNYFGISTSEIIMLKGNTSKIKIYEVPDKLKNFEVLPKQKSLL